MNLIAMNNPKPPERLQTATINDVARHAGVSYQTVSRVINQHPSVSAETRERVLQAVQLLDYHPSAAARMLAAKRSSLIGVVTSGLAHYGPGKMLASLDTAARNLGYKISMLQIVEFSSAEISSAIQQLRQQQVEGIIVFIPTQEVGANQIEQLCGGLPVVITDAEPGIGRYVTNMDHISGTRAAAQHLLTLGHRRIGFINGPLDWYSGMMRRQGWLSALNQAKLSPIAEFEGDWSAHSGYQATTQLLEQKLDITGLLVGNDQMALGALHALHQHNLELPRDMSVVGFDDIPDAEFFEPALTTVRQDFSHLAQLALEQLLAQVDQKDKINELKMISPHLLVRGSTAPPRS